MLSAAPLAFLTFAVAMLGSCGQRPLSATEQKIVGTWDRTGMDFTERTTYRPDRTLESTMGDGNGVLPFRSGTWRVEGNMLVEDTKVRWEPVPDATPFPRQVTKTPILELTSDKLVYEEGRPSLIRVR